MRIGNDAAPLRPRILVVDDDARNRLLLSHLLERDHDVDEATDGAGALAALEARPADLVLLDVMMPDLSGYEVCRRIKSTSAGALVPVLLVTALNDLDARKEGLARFIGVTGHGVTVAAQHLRALERFPFYSVLLPYSYVLAQNPQYAAYFEALVSVCEERGVAVQTIKSLVRAPWPEEGEHARTTWYEPLEDQAAIDLAVHWVLGRPGVFLNTAGDVGLLPRILDAAARFEARPPEEAMLALAAEQEMAPLFV